ncbi:MAG: cysteine--tRNA ligase [Patescibacteria group bacterium]
MLSLFNTYTGKKGIFTPKEDSVVSMYHCGPTVYKHSHIGNLRSYVFADILKRTILEEGFKVKQIINITDVGHLIGDRDSGEDKVEVEAKREHKSAQEIATFYTEEFFKDLRALNINTKDTLFPKATEHIEEDIELIKRLEEKGYTYATKDGIYFDTSKFKKYGRLGNINLAGIEEGSRIGINVEKRNPTDFSLWKFSPEETTRQQEWQSPWGLGFPGWHIECSAMSMKFLGETIDIHTGGIDHIPVHHNNEIAQSEGATGKEFVRFWLHNAFVNVDGGKMAKSEGNFVRLQSIVEHGIHPLSYRYWLLTAHYRTPILFSWEALESSDIALRKLNEHLERIAEEGGVIVPMYQNEFKAFLEDDLDTPKAIALLWKLIKDDTASDKDKKATILYFDHVLGLNLSSHLFEKNTIVPKEVKELIEKRTTARSIENWQEADSLRDQILAFGFEVRDTEHGTFAYKSRS